jgi:hypothetical protein
MKARHSQSSGCLAEWCTAWRHGQGLLHWFSTKEKCYSLLSFFCLAYPKTIKKEIETYWYSKCDHKLHTLSVSREISRAFYFISRIQVQSQI